MKNLIKISFLAILLMSLSSTAVNAQKFGHMNLGNFLNEMPDVSASNTQLESYQASLTTKGEQMVKAYEQELQKANEAAAAGSLSQVQIQEKQASLQKKQQELLAYEQEVVGKLQKKREELLSPILNKIEAAIQSVAKEGGYQMIFDTSVFNAILFAEDSEDVTSQVKAKLGI